MRVINVSIAIWLAAASVVALSLVMNGCGASQGGSSGSRLSNEAGTNVLDRDGDGLNDDHIFVGNETGGERPSQQSEVCGDGEDNDGDMDVDCADAECAMLPSCTD